MSNDELITKLALVLKQSGEQVLTGESKLSLTSRCLVSLGNAFRAIRSDSNLELSFDTLPTLTPVLHHNVHFLYDFAQKTRALKILGGKHGRGDDDCVDISMFHSLHLLEVKRFLLDRVTGLHRLRPQIRTLACTRSVHSVEEVFELCGGDQSGPMAWSKLTTVSLSHNKLHKLDESLRLLPILEVLDVSCNDIQEIGSHLEYLSELVYLNLGYNMLHRVPAFSLSSHTKLRTLVLCNNNLEHVYGVHELRGLRELDLAYNCICRHSALEPIKQLPKLNRLVLTGNPICYHTQHRVNTVLYLHPQAAKLFTLDGVEVSAKEHQYCTKVVPLDVTQESSVPSTNFSTTDGYSSQDYNYGDNSSTHDEDIIVRPFPKKKFRKSRNPRPVRQPEISDIDSDAQNFPQSVESTPSSTPLTQHHVDMKVEVEHLRSELGSDWLQTLTVKEAIVNKTREKSTNKKEATEDALYLKSNSLESLVKSAEKTVSFSAMDEAQVQPPIITSQVELSETDSVTLSVSCLSSHSNLVSDVTSQIDDKKDDETNSPVVVDTTHNNFYSNKHEHKEEIDYGGESEPFIVSHHDDADHSFLLSVSDRFLIEKDLEGNVTEMLDLHSILSADALWETGENTDEPQLQLMFDSVRKDRRERQYAMEDTQNAKVFLDLLQPALLKRTQLANSMSSYQCLKCSHHFKDVGHFGKKQDKNLPACPSCLGNKVIEIFVEEEQKVHSTPLKSSSDKRGRGQTRSLAMKTNQSDGSMIKSSSAAKLQDRLHEHIEHLSLSIPSENHFSDQNHDNTKTITKSFTDSEFGPRRNRQASTGSDIQVLDTHCGGITVQHELLESSDDHHSSYFSIQTSTTLRDSDFESTQDLSETNSFHSIETNTRSNEHTPCGSLSNKTISAMVTSVYETSQKSPHQLFPNPPVIVGSTADSDTGISFVAHSFHSDMGSYSGEVGESLPPDDCLDLTIDEENEDEATFLDFKMSYRTYKKVDHQLKLHLMLLLEDDEDLDILVKCSCVSLNEDEEIPCLIAASSTQFHVLKIVNSDSLATLDEAVKRLTSVPLVDISAIYLGLGAQYVTVVTFEKASCFYIIFRDAPRCQRFYKYFTAKVQETTFSSCSKLETISKNDPTMTLNLTSILKSDVDEGDTEVKSFSLCYLHSGDLEGPYHRSPVTLVVTATHLCVASVDWGWPAMEKDGKMMFGSIFTLKDRQRVTDLTELCAVKNNKKCVILHFVDESNGDESDWMVSMETYREICSVVSVIKEMWEAEYGVELQVT